MAGTFAPLDRVFETSVTTGVGDYTLLGAQTGFQTFSAIGANNWTTYYVTDDTNWEVCIGQVLAGPARVTRTTVLASSNAGAAVNWGAGTRKLRAGMPSSFGFPRYKSKSIAGGVDVNLTQDEQRCNILVLTGVLTANINVIVDDTKWSWIIVNSTTGAFVPTVKTAAGTGIAVPQNAIAALFNDGVNVQAAPNLSTVTGSFALTGDISPAQITANQNDYNPASLATASVLRLNTDASRNITGLAGGADGRVIFLINVGAQLIVLTDEDAASSAANRLALPGNMILGADDAIGLIYDATSSRWRPLGNPGGEKVLAASRDSTTASGNQDVTGFGFAPKGVEILAAVNGTVRASWGVADGSGSRCVFNNDNVTAGTFAIAGTQAIFMESGGGNQYSGSITFIPDGIRIAWTKTGSPTGTVDLIIKASH